MSTKTVNIVYWVSTILFCLPLTMSGFMGITLNGELVEEIQKLGYPSYFPLLLGAGKLLGVLTLLYPKPIRLKEWAYAGFTINLFSATIAHFAIKDELGESIMPLVLWSVLMVSYFFYHKRNS